MQLECPLSNVSVNALRSGNTIYIQAKATDPSNTYFVHIKTWTFEKIAFFIDVIFEGMQPADEPITHIPPREIDVRETITLEENVTHAVHIRRKIIVHENVMVFDNLKQS